MRNQQKRQSEGHPKGSRNKRTRSLIRGPIAGLRATQCNSPGDYVPPLTACYGHARVQGWLA